jgi:Ca2+-binding RTX toxin-like protein
VSRANGTHSIRGLLGNDVLCGDEGTDVLAGFAGDDRIFGGFDSGAGGDVIWPGVGSDFVDAGLDPVTRDDFALPADTVLYSDLLTAGFPGGIRADLTPVGGLGFVAEPSGTDQLVVTEALSIVGTRTDDVLIGSPYLDVLIGRGGADQIYGAGGTDTLLPDFTDSTIDPATDAADDIDGGPGMDWIRLGQAGGTARGGADWTTSRCTRRPPRSSCAVTEGGTSSWSSPLRTSTSMPGQATTTSTSGSPPPPAG